MTVVGLATNGADALVLVGELQPDLLVIENGGDDPAWLVEARRRAPGLKAVMLSSVDDPAHIHATFEASRWAQLHGLATGPDTAAAMA